MGYEPQECRVRYNIIALLCCTLLGWDMSTMGRRVGYNINALLCCTLLGWDMSPWDAEWGTT